MEVFKSQNPAEIKELQRAYWHSKTPEQRLEAALQLILKAKALYSTNPNNRPLDNGTHILKSCTPIERPNPILSKNLDDLENLPKFP